MELLTGLRVTVEQIQRLGNPGPDFTWSHVVNPILWLSLPGYRGALAHLWQELHLPLYPLDVLDASLRQLGLTTPAALRSWLESLGTGEYVRTWAYIPPEIQEAAMQELGVDAITQLVIINSSDIHDGAAHPPGAPTPSTRRQQAPAGGRSPAVHDLATSPGRCPSERAQALLGHLQDTIEGIQRDGPPDSASGWGHVGNALLWLSLPRHRAALVNVWARLRLPLQPLETLAEGLRQLELTTPEALREWLSTLASDGQRIPTWAQIPQEVQTRALHELRSEAGIQEAIIRSSAPCQAIEAHEPTCGVCRCPLAGTDTQAWPADCGHVLHLDCHLDLFRHAPPRRASLLPHVPGRRGRGPAPHPLRPRQSGPMQPHTRWIKAVRAALPPQRMEQGGAALNRFTLPRLPPQQGGTERARTSASGIHTPPTRPRPRRSRHLRHMRR